MLTKGHINDRASQSKGESKGVREAQYERRASNYAHIRARYKFGDSI